MAAHGSDHGPVGGAGAARLMRPASAASVAVAAALIVMKAAAWAMTGSVAMLSSLADSALDAVASAVNFFAVRHSLTPPDREHRFGHGKAEALAGLGQAALIGGSAVFLVFEAGRRLIAPQPIAHGVVGVTVTLIAIALTLGLVVYQERVARATGSLAIKADQLHYKSDLVLNIGVLAALGLSVWGGFPRADAIIALGLAGVIGWGAWGIVRQSLDHLMDRELTDEDRARIKEIALQHPEALDMHDLRTRQSGVTPIIQLHLELDPEMSLRHAHDVADEVERRIVEAYPGAHVIIHQDPAGLEEPPWTG